MRVKIFKSLRCPRCYAKMDFLKKKSKKNRIIDANLICRNCRNRYLVKKEIGLFSYKHKDLLCLRKFKSSKNNLNINQNVATNHLWRQADERGRRFLLQALIHFKIKGPIVDLCAGTGNFLCWLAELNKYKWELIAVDNSIKSNLELKLRLEKSNLYQKVSIIDADAQNLPLPPRYTDCVISHLGMFVKNSLAAIKEAHRILKPRGIFVFSHLIFRRGTKTYQSMSKSELNNLIRYQRIKQKLATIGFKIIDSKTIISDIWPGGNALSDSCLNIVKNDPFRGIMIIAQKFYHESRCTLPLLPPEL